MPDSFSPGGRLIEARSTSARPAGTRHCPDAPNWPRSNGDLLATRPVTSGSIGWLLPKRRCRESARDSSGSSSWRLRVGAAGGSAPPARACTLNFARIEQLSSGEHAVKRSRSGRREVWPPSRRGC